MKWTKLKVVKHYKSLHLLFINFPLTHEEMMIGFKLDPQFQHTRRSEVSIDDIGTETKHNLYRNVQIEGTYVSFVSITINYQLTERPLHF